MGAIFGYRFRHSTFDLVCAEIVCNIVCVCDKIVCDNVVGNKAALLRVRVCDNVMRVCVTVV